jgi:hypothetical protein
VAAIRTATAMITIMTMITLEKTATVTSRIVARSIVMIVSVV